MSLGIPHQLAPALFAQALSRLFFVYGAYAMITAEILQLIIGIGQGEPVVVASAIGTGLPGFLLWRMMFTPPSRIQGAVFVAILSASLVFSTWALLSTNPSVNSTMFTPLTLVSFGLVMVCGTAGRTNERLLWAAIGFAAANVSMAIGALLADRPYELDLRLVIGFGIILAAVFFTPRLLRINRRHQRQLDNSVELSLDEDVRSEVARKATMTLHDTLLANLALISAAKQGPLQPELRSELEGQLAELHGTTWFNLDSENSATMADEASDHIEQHDNAASVLRVLSAAENSGLAVNLTGNVLAVEKLSSSRLEALNGALTQCFANVLRHSGKTSAEVVVLEAGDSVSVSVTDGGVGFDMQAVPSDRMGLRLSVRSRIEEVGGSVRILSAEGAGTAVVMTLPAGGDSRG